MDHNGADSDIKSNGTRRSVLRMAVFGSAALSGVLAARAAESSVAGRRPTPAPSVRCLLRGAKVLTVKGETPVEDLAIGDLVPTKFGGVRPVQWIGRYPLRKSNPSRPWPKDALPVRIARSALAPNVPRTDLYVTQAHGVFIDDVLVAAGCLVNGTTITLEEASQRNELEFYHVKLESHDVIFAEGAPVETLLNVDESAVNFAEYFRANGASAEAESPCIPMLGYAKYGYGPKSRLRSAISWMDRRKRIADIRDRLAQRGAMLTRELAAS